MEIHGFDSRVYSCSVFFFFHHLLFVFHSRDIHFSSQETAKSIGDQIPWRSMSYAPSLRQVLLEYSDKVNDDHLAAVVAVCRGTLFVKDYYGQPIEPKWIFR